MNQPMQDVQEFVIDDDDIGTTDEYEVPEIEAKDDEVEIEIVDDTPEEDRGRTPLPKDEARAALEDDADEYSEKVQQRIKKLTRVTHDERRRADEREREAAEAARAAKFYHDELEKMKQAQQASVTQTTSQSERLAELEVSAATKAYEEAFEEGDAAAVAAAQQKLSEASAHRQAVAQWKAQQEQYAQNTQETLQTPQESVYNNQQEQQTPRVDKKTQEWVEANPWFQTDPVMHGAAMGVHQELLDEGFETGSDEYFEQVDARMRTLLPGKFSDEKPQKQQRPSTVVAPAGRSPAGKKVVLTESQVRIARQLGLTPQEYANGVAKMERGNRNA